MQQTIAPHWHNPEQIGNFAGPNCAYRLLTVEEVAVLFDEDPANAAYSAQVFEVLKPQYFHTGKAEWVAAGDAEISQGWTFRTKAQLLNLKETESEPVLSDEGKRDFVDAFRRVAGVHHAAMRGKGFWQSSDLLETVALEAGGEALAGFARQAIDSQKVSLCHTELSEAQEALRHDNPPDDKIPAFAATEAEYADVILRIMDHAHARGWDVAGALIAKIEHNATRPAKHGKQF